MGQEMSSVHADVKRCIIACWCVPAIGVLVIVRMTWQSALAHPAQYVTASVQC
jgi:hypothetical protein